MWRVAISRVVVRLEGLATKHDCLGYDINVPTDEVAAEMRFETPVFR